MDISRSSFPFEIVSIIRQIVKSHFVAIDLELSGIPVRSTQIQHGAKEKKTRIGKPTLQEVYEESREAANKFQILQVGMTIVHETDDGDYILRPYNFYISPVPEGRLRMERTWTFSSGAVEFLLRHQFQFEKPYAVGIPYISRQEERTLRASWAELDRAQESMPDMEVKPGDEAWVQLVKDNITDWLEQPATTRDAWLNLPPPPGTKLSFQSNRDLNAWQRRMIYQIVRNDFPSLAVTSKSKGSFMQVEERKPNHEQTLQSQRQRYRENDLAHATEFRWLIEALTRGDISNLPLECYRAALDNSERSAVTDKQLEEQAKLLQKQVKDHRTVLVGHNLFLDVLYIYQCFVEDLPEEVSAFQAMLKAHFAAIIDTKWIATFKVAGFVSTSLDSLEPQLREQKLPKVELAEGYDKYESNDAYHEAGFDSYMTAIAAIKLAAKQKAINAEAEAGTSLALFGIDQRTTTALDDPEEEFHTPPESVNDEIGSIMHTTSSSSSRSRTILSKPFATVKDAVAMIRPGRTKSTESDITDDSTPTEVPDKSSSKRESVTPAGVETVRQALGRTKLSNAKASDKVQSLFGRGQKMKSPADRSTGETEDLVTFDEVDRNVADKVRKGEMMPRWDDYEFWKAFGNRLKVQACTEGLMQL